MSKTTLTTKTLAFYRQHPIQFIETVLYDPESHQPFVLLPAERAFLEHAFTFTDDGRLLYREWLYSCPRKSGKTTFQALIQLTMVLLWGGAYPESYVCANDQEQAQSRVFEICKRIILASPRTRRSSPSSRSRSPPLTPPFKPLLRMRAVPLVVTPFAPDLMSCGHTFQSGLEGIGMN
jgi:hypothetical protein